MIDKAPPHGQLTDEQIREGAWIATGADLRLHDVLLYLGEHIPIIDWAGTGEFVDRYALTAGWPHRLYIRADDVWPILPRKEPA